MPKMKTDPALFELMQSAVDIVGSSPHPANKIAATLAGIDANGEPFTLSRTNVWPKAIEVHIGRDVRVGNSSGTIHAETACLLAAQRTVDASIFLTDPPCPNCVKYLDEAGVKAIYIDHKGFDKDFAQRRGEDFKHMSMRICEKAGMSVYEIWRKEQKLVPILEIEPGYVPPDENPIEITPIKEEITPYLMQHYIEASNERYGETPFAVAMARDTDGSRYMLCAALHPVIGYTSETVEPKDGKYSFLVQPITRLMMATRRHGLSIDVESLFSSTIPTARQLVNMVGAGLTTIKIGDMNRSRDEYGPMALKQLSEAGILDIKTT